MRQTARVCSALTLAALMAGCGGGGISAEEQRVCSADTFAPNYVRQLERLLYWERFPRRSTLCAMRTTPTTTTR